MKLSYKRLTLSVPAGVLLWLGRRMRWVRAAGCIVTAPDGTMLLIKRNGRWDLPKGKVEAGETLLQAALRETEEETGINNLSIPNSQLSIFKTYHIYNLYGGWHLKQTSWFEAHCGLDTAGTPQQEEGITEVAWVAPDEWHRRLQHSDGTLRTLAKLNNL